MTTSTDLLDKSKTLAVQGAHKLHLLWTLVHMLKIGMHSCLIYLALDLYRQIAKQKNGNQRQQPESAIFFSIKISGTDYTFPSSNIGEALLHCLFYLLMFF